MRYFQTGVCFYLQAQVKQGSRVRAAASGICHHPRPSERTRGVSAEVSEAQPAAVSRCGAIWLRGEGVCGSQGNVTVPGPECRSSEQSHTNSSS